MTGIERLREWAANQELETWCPPELPCEHGSPKTCKECMKDHLLDLADQIEREIDEAVADEVADTLSAYELDADAKWHSAVAEGAESDCNAEYELISRYWLPRPRFDDGEPVQFGDCISVKGCKETVQGFKFYKSGPLFVSIVGRDHEKWVRIEEGERIKRLEPPDTWESLAAEVEACDGSACRYFGRNEEEGGAQCCGCKAYGSETDCTVQVMRDIVRRAKKLAGVEE